MALFKLKKGGYMTPQQFIEKIAPLVQKYAPQYNIKVCSPVIAQAVLESASGTSELAVNAHNYFGLKYRAGRCPSACGIYYKIGSEQNPDGSYTSSAMQWMKFSNMDNGVKGYFDFINISNYANLKGVTDPKTYLERIKTDGYATSINYVQNLLNIIDKYNLTKYDTTNTKDDKTDNNNSTGGNKMVINIHAGHNPDGKPACGAVGLIKESTEARLVKDKVIAMLKFQGHTVYDCTCNDGTSVNNVLEKIVSKCNSRTVDLDISIHFNAGSNKLLNKVTTGTEVYVYSSTSKAKATAQNIVNAISALGFKNRGVKTSSTLYFLKKTKNPALLIECCFVDDPDDVALYNADKMAQAIVKGITGSIVPITNTSTSTTTTVKPSTTTTTSNKYVHNGLDYSLVFNPTYYANTYSDLKKAFGTNSTNLFNHFIQYGMKEGRQGISTFNPTVYKNRYPDLQQAFGNDMNAYYRHYIMYGHKEGRRAV